MIKFILYISLLAISLNSFANQISFYSGDVESPDIDTTFNCVLSISTYDNKIIISDYGYNCFQDIAVVSLVIDNNQNLFSEGKRVGKINKNNIYFKMTTYDVTREYDFKILEDRSLDFSFHSKDVRSQEEFKMVGILKPMI